MDSVGHSQIQHPQSSMSGIVGVYHRSGMPVDPVVLSRMLDVIAHRGPHGKTVWWNESVGLGLCMLHSTPESSAERLPQREATSSLVIAADVRIDNREELAGLLGLRRGSMEVLTDSEFVLAAYARWGTSCVQRLLGDFAFAIWDGPKQRLFCARDQTGVKPFYYHYSTEGGFWFASEIKALLEPGHVTRRVNENRIADYLMLESLDSEYTFFRDVVRLPAGHCLVVDRDGKRLTRYWSPDISRTLGYRSDSEYAEQFLEIFTESVRCRLRSAESVGITLSGGLDSSSIARVARTVVEGTAGAPLLTFSRVFNEGSECDESSYIRAVLQGGGYQSLLFPHLQSDYRPLSGLREICRFRDEPAFAPNAVQSWNLFANIAQSNARVVLDGHGGDETVSHAYGYLTEIAQGGRWLKLSRELFGLSRSGHDDPFWSLLLHYIVVGFAAGAEQSSLSRRAWRVGARLDRRLNRSRLNLPTSHLDDIEPSFARRVEIPRRIREWRETKGRFSTEREEHRQTISRSIDSGTFELLDAQASAFSRELRFPFWDRRLVEFCLMLPSEQKRSRGWGRVVLRRAMEGVLPPEIQWRRDKTDFLASVTEGVQRNELREVTRLRDGIGAIGDYVNVVNFRRICDRVLTGKLNQADFYALTKIATLYYWFEAASDSPLPRVSAVQGNPGLA
jgi:asparagine synthase (glutamine-hydrolysing)